MDGLAVCNTPSLDEFRLYPRLLHHLRNERASAMNEYRPHAGIIHEHYILKDILFYPRIEDRRAAVFYYDGLFKELLYIRKRLYQNAAFSYRILHVEYSEFI